MRFIKIWGKGTYFAPGRFSSRKNAKGITHVCYPKRSPMRFGVALQAVSAKTHLTLAVPAAVTLPAPLLVHHCVAPALRAQVARHTQVAQTQYACSRSSGDG